MKKKFPLFYKIIVGMVLGCFLGYFGYTYRWITLFNIAHTFSLFFTDLLKWLIPFLILSFMVPTVTKLTTSSSKLLFYVIFYTAISCYFAAFVSFVLSQSTLHWILGDITTQNSSTIISKEFFRLPLAPLLSISQALILSMTLILFGRFKNDSILIRVLLDIQDWVKILMKNLVLPLMPFYILTVFIKISAHGSLGSTLISFLPIIALIVFTDIFLVLFWSCLYGIKKRISPFKILKSYKTPILFGFASQSSSATLPLTLESCYQNGVSSHIVDFALPLATSINATGGTVAVVISSVALSLVGHWDTSWGHFLPFLMNVPLIIFSSVGVPGGASFVIGPLLDHMLHFDPSLIGLTQTIIILQDSISTATNVATCIFITLFIERKTSQWNLNAEI